MAEMKTHVISYQGEDVHFYETGAEHGETVVLLHSAFTDHRLFDRQTAELADDYRLLLVDLPGHGSFYRKESRIAMGDIAELIRLMLDHRAAGACHLVGVSLGALAAQAFAARHPERTMSLAAVGSYSIHKANAVALREQAKLRRRWIWQALLSIRRFRRHIVEATCLTEEGRRLAAEGAKHFTFASFRAFAGIAGWFEPKLHPVPYPLLIAVGEGDQEYLRTTALAWSRLEPGSRLIVLPGAGHNANADAPAELNKALREFWAGAAAG